MTRLASAAVATGLALLLPALASAEPKPKAGAHHTLAATKDNVQWGWFDVTEKPRLTVASGDTVSVETLYHALDQIKPKGEKPNDGPPMDDIARLRKENDGGGPHSITG